MHLLTDSNGMPLHFELAAGQRHDVTMADTLLDHAQGDACVVGSGYDSKAFVEAIEKKGMTPVIENQPTRKEKREVNSALYAIRY